MAVKDYYYLGIFPIEMWVKAAKMSQSSRVHQELLENPLEFLAIPRSFPESPENQESFYNPEQS